MTWMHIIIFGAGTLLWTSTAHASVRLDVDAQCDAPDADIALSRALQTRQVHTDLSAVVSVRGADCQATLEVQGTRSPLGPLRLGDMASVGAAATLIAWLLEPGGALMVRIAIVQARKALSGASSVSLGRALVARGHQAARGAVRVRRVMAPARAVVAQAWERALPMARSARVRRGARMDATRVAPAIGVSGVVTQLNGDTAAMWAVEAGAGLGHGMLLAGRVSANATSVQSRFEFVVLEDDEPVTRVRPGLSVWLFDAVARYNRRLLHEMLRMHVLASAGAAYVSRDDVEFRAQGWAPMASLSMGLSLGSDVVQVQTSLGYRLVTPVAFVGPQPWALSGPSWQLGVQWEGL